MVTNAVRGRWLAGCLMLAACTGAPAPSGNTTTTAGSDTSTSIPSPPTTVGDHVDWTSNFSVDLGGGYSLGRCEGGGEAPIVCVFKEEATVGTVEYLAFPVDNLDYLAGVTDPLDSARFLADDYVAGFRLDREGSCPHLEFRQLPEVEATVAALPGIRFGFSQFDGELEVERNVVFAAREGDLMRLVNAASLVEGACVAGEGVLTPADLEAIQEGLSAAVAAASFGSSDG